MKKLMFIAAFLCFLPFLCLAEFSDSFYPVEIGSCQVFFHEDWGFVEYTGEFDKLSPYDRMFFNSKADIVMLSIISYAEHLPQNSKTELFETANSIIKSFKSEDGSSIVTLGQVDNCPRITIVDESDQQGKTQWFIFSGHDVVYIGIISSDKYQAREYNSCLYYTEVNQDLR